MTEVTLVRGRWVITGGTESDAVLSDAALAVQEGSILDVGAWDELRQRFPKAQVIGSERVAVIPGLINAHHHSYGATSLQQGVPDLLLESWLYALRLKRPSDVYLDTLLSAARLLRSGVTTVVDVHSNGANAEDYAKTAGNALRAYDESGMRAAFAMGYSEQSHLISGAGEDERFLAGLSDDLRPLAEACLPPPDRLDRDDYFGIFDALWRDYGQTSRIKPWFAPPGPQWVGDDFMQRIAEAAARYDTGIQTHVEESLYEKLEGPRSHGQTTVEHLRDLGVLSPRFSIAHGVWLSEAEIAIMAESGAAVCHNPSSNLRLRAGIAPVNAYLAAGATVALGMDGTSLNDDEDMFTEMRLALRLQRTPRFDGPAPSPAKIFELATAGGARLLRAQGRLGRLAPGFAADLVLLDLSRIAWPWVAPEADPRELILLRAQAGDVDTVLVDGKVVLSEGWPTHFDVEAAGKELAKRLESAKRDPRAEAIVSRLIPQVEAYYRQWDVPSQEPYCRYNARR